MCRLFNKINDHVIYLKLLVYKHFEFEFSSTDFIQVDRLSLCFSFCSMLKKPVNGLFDISRLTSNITKLVNKIQHRHITC